MARCGLVVSLLLVGCKRPPDAPAALDELCAWLYTHTTDDEPDELQAGLANLDLWLSDHLDETFDGYTVQNLDQSTVDSLDDQDRDLEGLVGAAVGNDAPVDSETVADAIAMEDQMVVFPDTYNLYERTYLSGEDCWPSHQCDLLEVSNYAESNYSIIKVKSTNQAQYRWVETPNGWAVVHRTWLEGEAEITPDIVALDQQYYLTITLPLANGTTRRLQATWMIAELVGAEVPEATALNMVISSMQKTAEELNEWLLAQQ